MKKTPPPIHIYRITIITDDPAYYLKRLKGTPKTLFVLTFFASIAQAAAACSLVKPDCILIEEHLLGAIAAIRFNIARLMELCAGGGELPALVIMSEHAHFSHATAAIQAGALGYLGKSHLSSRRFCRILVEAIAERRRLNKQQKLTHDKESELEVAAGIQRGLLPLESPKFPNFDIAGLCVPARATGGDFWGFLLLPNGDLGVYMGDVCGKGVGSALIAAATRAFLRAFAKSTSNPGILIAKTNQLLCEDISDRLFTTIFFAAVNSNSRRLRYASAGDRAFYFKADGTVQDVLTGQGLAGVFSENFARTTGAIILNPGELLLLVTDGVYEVNAGGDGPKFALADVKAVVNENKHLSANEIVAALFAAARRLGNPDSQDDDMTIVVIKSL